jgi:hypothetical protein
MSSLGAKLLRSVVLLLEVVVVVEEAPVLTSVCLEVGVVDDGGG